MTQTIITVPKSEGFDPTDIEITDGVDDAFLIKDTSGDEWFKIDTRAGTTSNGQFSITMAPTLGQRVLIGGPNGSSGGPFSPLMVVNQNDDSYAMRIYGAYPYASSGDNQLVWGRDAQKSLWKHPLGGQFEIEGASGSFDFKDSSNASMFVINDDTSATYTLAQSGANYFTVKNDASANHCFRVNGNNRHTEIERIGFGGTQYIGYSGDYIQRSQPAHIDATSEVTSTSSLAVPDMNGSPGSGTFNNINKSTAIRIHSASQSASGDLFTATLNVSDAYKDLFREMILYVTNYDSTNAFALKIQASSSSGNWRELNSSGITGGSGQTIDAATTYVYRIFQHAPGNSTATRVYGIHFMGKMAH